LVLLLLLLPPPPPRRCMLLLSPTLVLETPACSRSLIAGPMLVSTVRQ
jgi:hypothetical protein